MKMLMKARTLKRFGVVSLALMSACAGKTKNDAAVGPPPVEHIEMDPIKISAVKGPDGVHLETFDVAELFEHAGKALAEKRHDDAINAYEQLLREFPGNAKYQLPSLYNQGLAYQGKKDWAKAADVFKKMAPPAPNSPIRRTRCSSSARPSPRWATGRRRRPSSRSSWSART